MTATPPPLAPAFVMPRVKPAGPPRIHALSIDFFLCLFSLEMLLLSSVIETWSAVGFILPWLWIILRRYHSMVRGLKANWQLLILPAAAMFSCVWSIEHDWTIKAGTEFMLTIIIGITAAYCIHPRTLICATLVALMGVAFASLLFGNYVLIGTSDEVAYVGIFASKNAFAQIMSLLVLTSVAVFLDKQAPLIFKLTAYLGVVFGPFMLYHGQSLGSMMATCLTIALYFLLRFLARLPTTIRLLAYIVIFATVFTATIVMIATDFGPNDVLALVGKNTTLTGRTELWDSAMGFISERPLLGVGYRTFWRVGYPPAEILWASAGVPSGSGFSFHNEYIQMLVELGIVGFIVLVFYLAVIGKRAIFTALGPLRSEQVFAFLVFIYLASRTPLEVGLFSQFDIVPIFICMAWVYFKPIRKSALLVPHSDIGTPNYHYNHEA